MTDFRALSILLPSYNNDCRPLIRALSAQAAQLEARGIACEIVVYDDCSTCRAMAHANSELCGQLPLCRYVQGERNVGRSAARNRLVGEARHDMLLFIDSDLMPVADDFLARYADAPEADAVVGGLAVGGADGCGTLRSNLRYKYERKAAMRGDAAARSRHRYASFHVSNLLVRRSVMTAHPFDESIRRYGYEDVLLGKDLERDGVSVEHIDNEVGFAHFDDNAAFLAKTEEGLATLHDMRDQLRGYSGVQTLVERLQRLHVLPVARLAYRLTRGALRRNLMGRNPSLVAFAAYRVGFYASLC